MDLGHLSTFHLDGTCKTVRCDVSDSYVAVYHGFCLYYCCFIVALCNRADHIYFHAVVCSSFFSSPNLSGRRLGVYHTLAHGLP